MNEDLGTVFRTAVLNNSGASRKEQFDEFFNVVRKKPALVEELAQLYFNRRYAHIAVDRTAAHQVALVQASRQTGRARATEAYERIKANVRRVILLDWELPNGKRLRECTGAELTKLGGFFAELARHMKPTQIVDKAITEAQAQDVYSRFFKSAEVAA